MGKNILPIILIVLAVGVYFSYTSGKIDEMKQIQAVNANYQAAITNARKLISVRDSVQKSYNNITEDDRARLDKMLPDNVDNVRLIIDVSGIASRHGFTLKNVATSASDPKSTAASSPMVASGMPNYNVVTISFNVTTTYDNFITFLGDIERSLRILDISKITLSANDNGLYDYGVEIRTYWLKQ